MTDLIEENVSGDFISWDVIRISQCNTLKKIHRNAFGKHTEIIKKYDTLPKLTTEAQSYYDLNQLMNSFINCEEIYLVNIRKLRNVMLGMLYQN